MQYLNNNPLLYYNGYNLVEDIYKRELIAKANRLELLLGPYDKNGNDIKSLKVEVIDCEGCSCSTNPFSFKYYSGLEVASVYVDWKLVTMQDRLATMKIRLKANYKFIREIYVYIIKLDAFVGFIPQNNLIGRGKLQIGTLRIEKFCESEIGPGRCTKTFRKIEIGNEIEGIKNVFITVDSDEHLVKSDVLYVPINESRDFKVFMDFGDNGIDKQFCYTFCFKLDGQKVSFGSKQVIIDPYVPQLTHRIELDRNEDGVAKQNLQDGLKIVGNLYVGSDAISGEQSIHYLLKTDSSVLKLGTELKNRVATILPNEEHSFPLVFHGNELPQLPETPIQIKVLDNEVEIESVFLVKKTNDEKHANQIVLTAPSFAKINNGERRSVTIYSGNKETIELPLEITKESGASNVGICLKPADNGITEIDTATTTNYPFAHKSKDYSIKINVAPIEVGKKDVSVCASAPYHKDASCVITINCKEKKTPKIKFSFKPSSIVKGKDNDSKFILYHDCIEERIGELTLQCCAEQGVPKPRKEHYKLVNLESDLILLSGNHTCIHLTQKGDQKDHKTSLSIGESVSFDVIVEPVKSDIIGEINLSFKCFNDQANNIPKIIIKEKVPEDIPAFSFNPESGIIFPVNQELIKVGTISIQLPEQSNGKYKRENGSIYFDENSHFYFSNELGEKQEHSRLINRLEKIETVPVYFDANQYFDCTQNIEKEETIQLHLKYKDENVDKELIPVPVDSEKWEFVVKPYPAEPILKMVLVDAKGREKGILFDDSSNAVVEIADGIQYTQAMLCLPPGRKFKLKVKNSQTICLPKKYIKLSEIKSDKEFILIDANDEYCIYNGGNEETIDIRIDWGKIRGECSGFNVFGKIDDKPFVISVRCLIYEKIATNWRSLDLGTSAVVLAKMHRDNISTVIDTVRLSDTEQSLESHEDMISSVIALHKGEETDCHELVLSPERRKYNQATALLPPLKFLVGQQSLPFVDSFQKKGIHKLKSSFLGEVVLDKQLSPTIILESIYKDIFSRIDKAEQDDIKKLILTYPSTYTIEQIDSLKKLILNEFPNIQAQNLDFVAESDAVLAQYLYSKRTSIGGSPLKHDEKILIYDMGAGTLDISYVRIKIENEGEKNQITKAIIEKRIGIPVAGNYLDYCIFKYLEPYIDDAALKQPQALKKNIQELKKSISDNTDQEGRIIGEVSGISLKTDKKKEISYQEIVESEYVKEFFTACSDGVFELLLGDKWKNEKITFVYSGRGCLFRPLINHIKILSGWNPEPIAPSSEEMKLCASKGAIRYVQMFSKEAHQPFVIESFKYYASFGLVYRSYADDGKTETYKCKILKSSDDFKVSEKECFHAFIPEIDIRPEGPLILVQTYLSPNRISESFNKIHLNKEDNDGCYITEIFRVFRGDLGLEDSDLQRACVDFTIDDYKDTIKCTVMNQPLNDYKFSESIENNEFYKKSMWPFNN